MIDDIRPSVSGWAVVARGSGGLGGSISRALARKGSSVVVGYNTNTGAAEATAAEVPATGTLACARRIVLLDEVLPQQLSSIRHEMGPIAAAVYASGPSSRFDFVSRTPLADWRRVLEADVLGCIALAQAAIPHLRETARSFTALATYQANKIEIRSSHSSVPKAAIERLVQVIAKEEACYGVRANAVRAGWIDAGGGNRLTSGDAAMLDQKISEIPLRRLGRSWELAEAVAFLASPAASFVSGIALTADGGESL